MISYHTGRYRLGITKSHTDTDNIIAKLQSCAQAGVTRRVTERKLFVRIAPCLMLSLTILTLEKNICVAIFESLTTMRAFEDGYFHIQRYYAYSYSANEVVYR